MRTRSLIVRWLLALLLLVSLLMSQQLAVVHAVSHIADARPHTSQHKQQNKQLPAEQSCAQCLAFAQIDSALTGSALPAQTTGIDVAVSLVPAAGRLGPDSFSAFHSRAPPVRT
jgi:hypothetical protein